MVGDMQQGPELIVRLREVRVEARRVLVELRQQPVGLQRITGAHPADADDTFSDERVQVQRRRTFEERVRALDYAIERLERDGVIRCEDCGEFISPKRILVAPAVTRCVGCQCEREAAAQLVARSPRIAFC